MTSPETPRGGAFAPTERPGALLAGLALWLAVTVVASALLAPLAFGAIEELAPGRFPFERVFRRVAMLVALAHLIVWLRRSGVRSWAAAGFTRAGWGGGSAWRGAAVGLAAAAALFAIELAAGTRIWNPELGLSAIARALLGGAAIGLLEEGVFRGALVFPFGRLAGWTRAGVVAAISAVYAAGHFARTRGGVESIDWTSGFELWGRAWSAVLANPEPLLGLFLLGVLFDALARRQGHLWGAAGLHAGAVAAIQLGSDLTDPLPEGGLFFTNGLHPAWPLATLLALAVLAVHFVRRESPGR